MVKAIVGANWGDEGKGKITDVLANDSDIVIRFQGGANAGHTIVNDYGKFALHQLPSGIFHQNITNIIGNGVAFSVENFVKEMAHLEERGVPKPNVIISDRAQIVMPYHVAFDCYEEERLGKASFGSTKSGIAPFYGDKYLKIGIQVCQLYDQALLRQRMASAVEHGRTILRTKETTVDFTSHTIEHLNRVLAPCVTRHGVLLDIHGVGVMITGDSGVGKSEAAIELIMRGHRLVADDAVELRRISNQLIGTAPEVIRHYIELRGIGVIDLRQLFGMRAIKVETQLDLVVHFEPWDQTKFYDRLGIEDHYTEMLDVQVPIVTIPVRPGRSLASIVEVAAMNNRHRKFGFNAAQELVRRVDMRADGKSNLL